MTSCVENETKRELPFSASETAGQVVDAVLAMEKCPYEVCVNILLTDNRGIREYNKEYRQIDQETDVLSFPNLAYREAGDFSVAEETQAGCFDFDTGELILGDIIISIDKIEEQAKAYGHSMLREFAFLVSHSMFHLCGYDHMTEEESVIMEQKQEAVLQELGITRED